MDPASAIGITGAAIDIVGVLTRVIKNANELRSKYRHANLMFNLLDHQLTTLRHGLQEISKWHESDCSPQLISGSESSVQGISILVMLLDEKLQMIQKNNAGSLTFQGNLTFLWDHSELREHLNQLNGQIMSLSVLLHAYTYRSLAEQQAVMNDEENREVVQSAEDAASSLITNDDIQSRLERLSVYSEDSLTWSKEFDFDTSITNSRVYRLALRSNMRKALPRPAREHACSASTDSQIITNVHFENQRRLDQVSEGFEKLNDWPNSPFQSIAGDKNRMFYNNELGEAKNDANSDTASIVTVRHVPDTLPALKSSPDEYRGNSTVEAMERSRRNISESKMEIAMNTTVTVETERVLSKAYQTGPERSEQYSVHDVEEQIHNSSIERNNSLDQPIGARREFLSRFCVARGGRKPSSHTAQDEIRGHEEEKGRIPDEQDPQYRKLLHLRISGVGKSTLLKSIRCCLGEGFSAQDRQTWRVFIRKNIINSFLNLFKLMAEEDVNVWQGILGCIALYGWLESEPEDSIDNQGTFALNEHIETMEEMWNHPLIRQLRIDKGD